MAEAGTNPTGTPSQAAPVAAGNTPQGSQQQSSQSQDPAWFQHVPEQYREDAKKSYMLHSDYTRKTQELSEKQKQWEAEQQKYKDIEAKYTAYQQWAQQYGPTFEAINKHWDRIAPILNGQAANQNIQAQGTQNNGQLPQGYFENWDVLPAEQQAHRMAEYIGQNVLAQQLGTLEQKIAQMLSQKEQFFGNYLNIMTEAFNRKFQNPELDLPGYMQKALEISAGKFKPLDIAYEAMTNESSTKRMQEEWLKKGKEEALLEMKNQQQSVGAMQQSYVPVFKQQPISKTAIKEQVRNEAAQKGISWNSSF